MMSAIRRKDTAPEMFVRRALHKAGFRYRLHRRDLPGSPDIVLSSLRTVIFVHGCFWHLHGCSRSTWPKTRAAFWRKKLEANQARDRRTALALKQAEWRVEAVWECELVLPGRIGALLLRLERRKAALGGKDRGAP